MQSHERIERQAAALEWLLGNAVHGYLDSHGFPSYDIQDMDGIERGVVPDEYIKDTLDAVVRGSQLNGAKMLSPRPPIDPTREQELDATIALQLKMIDSLERERKRGDETTNELNAYQNMLIRFIVMFQASKEMNKPAWQSFANTVGDILIHWSKDRNKAGGDK